MKPIQAGQLRHQVEIQSVSYAPDANGERVATWTTLDAVYASLRADVGREQERSRAVVATQTHTAMIRYYPRLTVKMRLRFRDRHFLINAINNVEERNIAMILSLTEIIGQ